MSRFYYRRLSGKLMKSLSLKERKFADETIKTLNPTEAARRAYNIGIRGGTNKNTASVIASKELRKVKIQEYIETRLNDVSDEEIVAKVRSIMHEGANREALTASELLWKFKHPNDLKEDSDAEIKVIIKSQGEDTPSIKEIYTINPDILEQ